MLYFALLKYFLKTKGKYTACKQVRATLNVSNVSHLILILPFYFTSLAFFVRFFYHIFLEMKIFIGGIQAGNPLINPIISDEGKGKKTRKMAGESP